MDGSQTGHSHIAGAALVLYFVQQITPPICPAARPEPRRDYGFSLSPDSRERLNPESRRDSGLAAGLLGDVFRCRKICYDGSPLSRTPLPPSSATFP